MLTRCVKLSSVASWNVARFPVTYLFLHHLARCQKLFLFRRTNGDVIINKAEPRCEFKLKMFCQLSAWLLPNWSVTLQPIWLPWSHSLNSYRVLNLVGKVNLLLAGEMSCCALSTLYPLTALDFHIWTWHWNVANHRPSEFIFVWIEIRGTRKVNRNY